MRRVPQVPADDQYAPGSDETFEAPELEAEADDDPDDLVYDDDTQGEQEAEGDGEAEETGDEQGEEEAEGEDDEQTPQAPYRPAYTPPAAADYVARYGEVLGEEGATAVAAIVQSEVNRALAQLQATQALSAADPYEPLVQRNLLNMERTNPGAIADPNARAAAELFAVAEIGQARGDVWGEIERFAQRKRAAAAPEKPAAAPAAAPAARKPAAPVAPAPPAARPTRPSVSRPAEVAPARGGSEADAAARRVAKRFGVDIDEARNGVRDARRLATRRAD